MQLSPQALQEFKHIYREEFGEEITDAQAREMGTRLLRVFRTLLEVSAQVPKNEPPNDLLPDRP